MSACRSCGAPIIWAKTEAGKRIPLDAQPAERPTGVFKLVGDMAVSVAGEPVYISHFATCPDAKQWRQ